MIKDIIKHMNTENLTKAVSTVDTNRAYEAIKKTSKRSASKHNLFVLKSLVIRDFKLKYRRSILGVLWSILNPLLMMIVLAAVFSYMFRFQIEHFPLYLILGTILFDYMNRGTTGSLESVIHAQSLIKKIRINKMIFPIEKVLFELINFAISLIAVVIVMAYFQVVPSIHALWGLPLLVFFVTLFTTGIGLLLSSLSVFFRDITHLWGVLMTAWTYATPLFYPLGLLPDWMKDAMVFNPMYHYVTFFRDIMMWNINPGLRECLICFAMAAITFLIGFVVFKSTQKKFILHI